MSDRERNAARLYGPESSFKRLQTVGAGAHVMAKVTPRDGIYRYTARMESILNAGTAGAWIEQRGAFYAKAGVPTLMATPVVEGVCEAGTGLATTDLVVAVAGADITVSANGIAGKTLNTAVLFEVFESVNFPIA